MNEFLARKGLIVLGNTQISGTTSITGDTTIIGNLILSPSGSTISGNGGGLYNIPTSGVTDLNNTISNLETLAIAYAIAL